MNSIKKIEITFHESNHHAYIKLTKLELEALWLVVDNGVIAGDRMLRSGIYLDTKEYAAVKRVAGKISYATRMYHHGRELVITANGLESDSFA
jgi:hypothetical protein